MRASGPGRMKSWSGGQAHRCTNSWTPTTWLMRAVPRGGVHRRRVRERQLGPGDFDPRPGVNPAGDHRLLRTGGVRPHPTRRNPAHDHGQHPHPRPRLAGQNRYRDRPAKRWASGTSRTPPRNRSGPDPAPNRWGACTSSEMSRHAIRPTRVAPVGTQPAGDR